MINFQKFLLTVQKKILNIIGKLLTPAIIIILLLLIGNVLFSFPFDFSAGKFPSPFADGILEGYQTFDAIGAVVVGGVIIISINLENAQASYTEKKALIRKAGWLAGLGLFLIYAGLILSGAMVHGSFDPDITRTALLSGMATLSLGAFGNLCLSILVCLACFTTAVGNDWCRLPRKTIASAGPWPAAAPVCVMVAWIKVSRASVSDRMVAGTSFIGTCLNGIYIDLAIQVSVLGPALRQVPDRAH